MKITDVRKINDEIYKLYSTLEDIGEDELSCCRKLYEYYCESAREKSIAHNTEGSEELFHMIENGLDEEEIEYIQTYELSAFEAWKFLKSELFKNFCYYKLIKEEIEAFEL